LEFCIQKDVGDLSVVECLDDFFWSLAYGVDIMIPLNNDFRSLLLILYLDVDFKYSALLPCIS
jgi:hypothetical protein